MNDKRVKVEFIESYIKIGNGDYQWNDNHGELIRCKDCKYLYAEGFVHQHLICEEHPELGTVADNWFCADGERRTN